MPTRQIVHIIEDHPAVRESLALLLQSAGFGTERYASAQEFL